MVVKLTSSDGIRSVSLTTATFIDPTTITFTFPNNVFLTKDFVKIAITFEGIIYFVADERIIVYDQIILA